MMTKMAQYLLCAALSGVPFVGIAMSPPADASLVTPIGILPSLVMSQASKEASGEPPKKAVISFSGTGNKSVTVIDHRTNTSETRATSSLTLNQLKEIRVESPRKPVAEPDETVVEAEEVASDEESKTAATQEAESAESPTQADAKPEMTEAEKKAAHEADLRSGIKTLQGQGLIVYGDSDAIPETIYDPFTKQYIPVEQAVKRLREREEKAEADATQPQ